VIKSHVLYRLSYGLERIEKALLMWGSHGLRKPQVVTTAVRGTRRSIEKESVVKPGGFTIPGRRLEAK
jgi:hypothetical protein